MTFTTLTFLIFYALVFALYWAIPRRQGQNLLIVAASYFFYSWWDWRFCGLMAAASLLDFFVGLALDRLPDGRRRKGILALGLTGNLLMLGFFKYFNFFAENFHALAAQFGWHVNAVTLNIVLPVGISFYTFQTMSYSLDIYRRQMRASTHLIEYLAFVSFFPQLVAGPIERAHHLLPQFLKARVFDYGQAVDGCRQALWGFFKKMVIADNLAPIVDAAYAAPAQCSGPELALATVAFAFQIYCDFSAYSDIAIGTAKLLGFQLMRNFALPYFSQSPMEFWRRWHISLSTWFKDYVYLPLGGNRVGQGRLAANLMFTFVLSGLWHGAAWTFILWGAINGIGVLVEHMGLRRSKATLRAEDYPAPNFSFRVLARIAGTFLWICLGWVFFRARDLNDAGLVLKKILTGWFDFAHYSTGLLDRTDETGGRVLILVLVLVALEWWRRQSPHPLHFTRLSRPWRWVIYTVLVWAIMYLGTYGNGQFIYFQF